MNSPVEMSFEKGTLALTLRLPRLDGAAARDLKAACDAQWPDGVERLTIDLSEVEFVDSSGIGALLSLYKRLPPAYGTVHLLHLTRPVRSVIELLRLQRVFVLEELAGKPD